MLLEIVVDIHYLCTRVFVDVLPLHRKLHPLWHLSSDIPGHPKSKASCRSPSLLTVHSRHCGPDACGAIQICTNRTGPMKVKEEKKYRKCDSEPKICIPYQTWRLYSAFLQRTNTKVAFMWHILQMYCGFALCLIYANNNYEVCSSLFLFVLFADKCCVVFRIARVVWEVISWGKAKLNSS